MNSTSTAEPPSCLDVRYWFYFLSTSLLTYVSGLVLILIGNGIHLVMKKHERLRSLRSLNVACYVNFKRACQFLVSGRTLVGRILVSLSCCLSIGSLVIYLIETSEVGGDVETCGESWTSRADIYYLDFFFNIFFLFFFIIKFQAVDNKLLFWFDLNSLVDFSTIPPSFVSIALRRQWLGLRFMRAFRIMSIPDMLQYLKILRSAPVIRFAQLFSMLISTVLAAAGFIHLLELSGDWFVNFENSQSITYWESLYLTVATMSTVGYGDITCKTVCGRIFICFFILTALASIASFIPEIVELVGSRNRRFKTSFQVETGMKHVVVCGHISYNTFHNFIRDFLHPDRRETKMIKVVILDNKNLELEMQALLKGYFTRVVFINGSPLSVEDLKRVKMTEADACIIMANRQSAKLDVDDVRNIMKVISIKNFSPTTQVIIQLLKSQNKKYFENLPWWDKNVDQIVCMFQLKLGLMSAGCVTPGFSTLLANLVVTLALGSTHPAEDSWFSHYTYGASMEIYRSRFSRSFVGKTFEEVAKLCYSILKLMLIGVTTQENGEVFVNPSFSNFIIQQEYCGLFICQEESDVQKVQDFCQFCHFDVTDLRLIKKCRCGAPRDINSVQNERELQLRPQTRSSYIESISYDISKSSQISSETHLKEKEADLRNHIVVCSGNNSNFSEMKSFIKQLKMAKCCRNHDIVSFAEESGSSSAEWKGFCKKEGVLLKKGSPLIQSHLEEIHIERCMICVVLSGVDEEDGETSLNADVQSILTTLYIRNTIRDIINKTNAYDVSEKPLMLTEIAYDANVVLVGEGHSENKSCLYLAKSFAMGNVFGTSLLDAFLSMIYCNPGSYNLIKALVNLEEDTNSNCYDAIRLLSIANSLLSKNRRNEDSLQSTYGDLFLNALYGNGILCLGLYRHFSVYSEEYSTKKRKRSRASSFAYQSLDNERFVFTNPPSTTHIYDSDLVYCLVPSRSQRFFGPLFQNDTSAL